MTAVDTFTHGVADYYLKGLCTCRDCAQAFFAEVDEIADKQRAYREANKAEIADKQRAYYEANKAEILPPPSCGQCGRRHARRQGSGRYPRLCSACKAAGETA